MEIDDVKKQEQMKDYYDSSEYYKNKDQNFADRDNRFKRQLFKNVLSIYQPTKNELILDCGCGWGNISLEFQKQGFNITGLDYSEKSIDICIKTAEKLGLDNNKFICADATDTKMSENTYDVIICADLVEHLYPDIYLSLVREMHRILKPGGHFIVYTPNPVHIIEQFKRRDIIIRRDIAHVDYKTMGRLKSSLIDTGFEIEKAVYLESHLPGVQIIEKLFMKFIPLLRRRNGILAVKR